MIEENPNHPLVMMVVTDWSEVLGVLWIDFWNGCCLAPGDLVAVIEETKMKTSRTLTWNFRQFPPSLKG